jgi:hypothetical protein
MHKAWASLARENDDGLSFGHGKGYNATSPVTGHDRYNLRPRNELMNADLSRRTDEIVSRLTQLRDSL